MLTGSRSAFCDDSNEQSAFGCVECDTSIAARLVASPILVIGHSIDSGVELCQLESTGACGSDVYTSSLVHCPAVADQSVAVAVGSAGVRQCDLCGGGQYFSQPNTDWISMGIFGCVLRTHGHRSFLISQEFSCRRSGGALHCCQHLSATWVVMGGDLSSDRQFLSGFNPDGKRPSRPSDRTALFQPDHALYGWVRRYSAA